MKLKSILSLLSVLFAIFHSQTLLASNNVATSAVDAFFGADPLDRIYGNNRAGISMAELTRLIQEAQTLVTQIVQIPGAATAGRIERIELYRRIFLERLNSIYTLPNHVRPLDEMRRAALISMNFPFLSIRLKREEMTSNFHGSAEIPTIKFLSRIRSEYEAMTQTELKYNGPLSTADIAALEQINNFGCASTLQSAPNGMRRASL